MVLVISLQNHFTPLPKSIHLSYVHFVPGKNISSQDQNFKLSQTQSATSLHIIICKKVKIKWWQNLKLKRSFREKKHVYLPFLFSKMVAKHICIALIILYVNSYLFGSLVVNTSFGLGTTWLFGVGIKWILLKQIDLGCGAKWPVTGQGMSRINTIVTDAGYWLWLSSHTISEEPRIWSSPTAINPLMARISFSRHKLILRDGTSFSLSSWIPTSLSIISKDTCTYANYFKITVCLCGRNKMMLANE